MAAKKAVDDLYADGGLGGVIALDHDGNGMLLLFFIDLILIIY